MDALLHGEPGAQVYSAAFTRQQAKYVFDPAQQMVASNDILREECQVIGGKNANRIVYGNSYYVALAAEAGTIHGANPHCVIFDELHVQKNSDLWDALRTGMGNRKQPLWITITTAGFDRTSLCYREHEKAKKLIDGTFELESFYAVIFAADDDDDIFDESIWEKANPNLDVSITRDFLRAELAQARMSPAYEPTVRRLYFNQWTEMEERWLPMFEWDACKGKQFTEEELRGRICYVGLDLSATRDLSALVALFPEVDGDGILVPGGGFDLLCKFYMPTERGTRQQESERLRYRSLVPQWITGIPLNRIDQSVIRADLWRWQKMFEIHCVAADPWNCGQFWVDIHKEGWPEDRWEFFGQTIANFNEAMKSFLDLLLAGKVNHGHNPVLRDNAANLCVKMDASGNMKPDKEKSQGKIDGMVATLQAHGLHLHRAGHQTLNYYETHELEYL